jgi:NAD(P)H-dependent flavin oxidoreductase YrpB (nitropropane dioxygenase family)
MGVAGGPRREDDRRVSTLRTRLRRQFGNEHPILSVGMGMAAGPAPAAAVSNSGGPGVLGTHDLSAETIQASRAARMEHLESQLAAVDVVLDEAVRDRIDEIVPPGTTINPVDNSVDNPALQPASGRRQGAS